LQPISKSLCWVYPPEEKGKSFGRVVVVVVVVVDDVAV
jgi:hypothetical protein